MSWSKFDITDSEREKYFDNCEKGAAIHSFDGLKSLLSSLGYHVEDAVGYKAIEVADVTIEEINKGTFEFTDDGIFVNTDGVRRQIFLYKRNYKLTRYGKPRFHIRKCHTIQSFMNSIGSIPEYRRANTEKVWVHDMDDNMIDKEIDALPLCKFCRDMVQNASHNMTNADFVQFLKNSTEASSEENIEIDIFGYTKDWEFISRGIREKYKYTCENCGLQISDPYDQHYIHVHHKNGRKIDNRESNLQCLCLRCHANVDDNHRHRLTESSANRIIYEGFCDKYPELY